jgi:hypothetical protein
MGIIHKFIFKKALAFVQRRVIRGRQLTPELLFDKGWSIQEQDGKQFFVEPNIKEREKVWIAFENHYYRVWHGHYRTFVALESTVEWLHTYFAALDKHNELSTRKLI